jgi:hypothetical protein
MHYLLIALAPKDVDAVELAGYRGYIVDPVPAGHKPPTCEAWQIGGRWTGWLIGYNPHLKTSLNTWQHLNDCSRSTLTSTPQPQNCGCSAAAMATWEPSNKPSRKSNKSWPTERTACASHRRWRLGLGPRLGGRTRNRPHGGDARCTRGKKRPTSRSH